MVKNGIKDLQGNDKEKGPKVGSRESSGLNLSLGHTGYEAQIAQLPKVDNSFHLASRRQQREMSVAYTHSLPTPLHSCQSPSSGSPWSKLDPIVVKPHPPAYLVHLHPSIPLPASSSQKTLPGDPAPHWPHPHPKSLRALGLTKLSGPH